MNRRTRLAAALAPIALLGLLACGGGDDADEPVETTSSESAPSGTELTYRYQDASVAPEYHRSYELSLTGAGEGAAGELVVDAYGEELHRVEVRVDAGEWGSVVTALEGLDLAASRTVEGCAGGTGRELRLERGGEPVVVAAVDVCGDQGKGQAARIDRAIAPLLADVDMATLLAES